MTNHRKISLCITTYNRVEVTLESFSKVYNDERIKEIIIVDDHSRRDIYEDLARKVWDLPKVKLHRNAINFDCYRNKFTAVSLAKSDYVILLDSDNIIDLDYLDKIYDYEWVPQIILTPDFAKPQFDFRAYSDLLISKSNIADYIDKPMFETMCNACNYFVHRDEYLRAWNSKLDPVTSDSIYMTWRWLDRGNKIQVVPGLQYEHRVWQESHYRENVGRTPAGFHQSILKKISELK